MSEIAQQVRTIRTALGLSQGLLAEKAGVSRPSVARVEAGEGVSTDTLAKITDALGLKLVVTAPEEPEDG
ncbi:helix-turn-helix domain-containing protein [Glutamicibacter sp. BSL13]